MPSGHIPQIWSPESYHLRFHRYKPYHFPVSYRSPRQLPSSSVPPSDPNTGNRSWTPHIPDIRYLRWYKYPYWHSGIWQAVWSPISRVFRRYRFSEGKRVPIPYFHPPLHCSSWQRNRPKVSGRQRPHWWLPSSVPGWSLRLRIQGQYSPLHINRWDISAFHGNYLPAARKPIPHHYNTGSPMYGKFPRNHGTKNSPSCYW